MKLDQNMPVEEAGVKEAGVKEAGVKEAGVEEAGVISHAENSATSNNEDLPTRREFLAKLGAFAAVAAGCPSGGCKNEPSERERRRAELEAARQRIYAHENKCRSNISRVNKIMEEEFKGLTILNHLNELDCNWDMKRTMNSVAYSFMSLVEGQYTDFTSEKEDGKNNKIAYRDKKGNEIEIEILEETEGIRIYAKYKLANTPSMEYEDYRYFDTHKKYTPPYDPSHEVYYLSTAQFTEFVEQTDPLVSRNLEPIKTREIYHYIPRNPRDKYTERRSTLEKYGANGTSKILVEYRSKGQDPWPVIPYSATEQKPNEDEQSWRR